MRLFGRFFVPLHPLCKKQGGFFNKIMYKSIFNKREVLRFKQFSNKGYSLFSCLGREVIVGTLSVATLTYAKADGVSIRTDLTEKDQPQYEVVLDDVEVSGSRAPLALGQAARMVTVLSRDEIQAAPVQSINDLLKYAAGVDVRQRGPIGAQTDIGIRGGTQEQITILLNGINICDPQTGHNSFDFPVDISEIERIEVLEGPAGRVYGTSSLAGAINIVTRNSGSSGLSGTAGSSREATLHMEGGSFGYLSAGGYGNITSGRWSNQLSASFTRSDGYSRNKDGGLNMDYSGGKAFYQGRFEDPGLQVRWHAGLSTKGFGSNTFYSKKFDNQYEKTTKWFTTIQAETKGGWFHFKPAIYWNRSQDRFELIRNASDKYPFNYHRSDVFGVNLNSWFDWALGRTALGAEFRNEDVISGNLGEPLNHTKHISGTDRDYEFGLNRSNISFHLEHNILLNRFTLSAGFIAVKNTWNEMNFKLYPGVDASYRFSENWKLYASWNTSLRMPSVTELYYSVGGHKADKYLKPEELSAVETGIKYQSRTMQASISGFYHHTRNMIDWIMNTTEAEPVWKSMNYTKVNMLGLEAILHFDFKEWMPQQDVLKKLYLSYCYMNQEKDQNEEQIKSQSKLEYLRHKLVASLQLHLVSQLNLNVKYRFQDRAGSYTDMQDQIQDYAPYSLVDARLSWNAPRYDIYAEANNLLNKKDYVDYGNVPQPGFWFTAGIIARF